MKLRDHYTQLILKRVIEQKQLIKSFWQNSNNNNQHTKYCIIDNLLPQSEIKKIYEVFPKNAEGFFNRKTFREKKKTATNLNDYNPYLVEITYALQSKKVVKTFSDILNIKYLEGDPSLYAGGISMMFKDDFLNPHIDNSHDARREKYRRLNLLYYTSPNWNLDYGGNLELWDRKVKNAKTIIANQNRLVIMETNRYSWHSVSKVKVERPRCCISNYYFSKESPETKDYFHVTSFTGRPDEKLKRVIGKFDNALRSFYSIIFKSGRNKKLINVPDKDN